MARSSMAALIARLRLWAEDSRAPQLFTDDQLQDFLDGHRVRLASVPAIGDPALRLEYRSPYPNLEDSTVLRGVGGGSVITPTTANFLAGSFSFDQAAPGHPYIWGYAYDLNAAAADAWRVKAGQTHNMKGQYPQYCQEQIKRFEAKVWPVNSYADRVYQTSTDGRADYTLWPSSWT